LYSVKFINIQHAFQTWIGMTIGLHILMYWLHDSFTCDKFRFGWSYV